MSNKPFYGVSSPSTALSLVCATTLRDDELLLVLSFLPQSELLALRLASQSFRLSQLTEHDVFWQPIYLRSITKLSKLHRKLQKILSQIMTMQVPPFIDLKQQALKESRKQVADWKYKGPTNPFLPYNQLKEIKFKSIKHDNDYKIVFTGDGAVGKSSLIMRYNTGEFPCDYVPTVYDNCTVNMTVGEIQVTISPWDTAGQSEYDRLRPLSYPGTDVYFVCCSCNNIMSLHNIYEKWVPEIRCYTDSNPPIVLVMNKIDLRSKQLELLSLPYARFVMDYQDGEQIARKVGCCSYLETSALHNINVSDLTEVAVKSYLFAQENFSHSFKSKKCCLI
ncbi:hypothetical protein C9374_002053 [Naegleria lovaniensis]|uniref:Uncharacterized protein n=1 Tax=Naegleria lovaniensis TaxID=51637 RepID=A0AA88GVD4_NAELO|nr:uncharacterized protein C9374_002053 [Naegleria lovaniensis]KAG2387018.1 hypothetical protein C9374_002053 [Naegleria lovaniensis]